ncbi:hypothetical protein [Bacillus sp. Marseille-Q3570]|uniref:hypothetical protein n=1 Tax=Bacillus sp. Marseille-Q3570 TaxID=2963522 RepID=UPI0021B7CCA2|nr:hypothetical protein [Bacillus sp. Marseille-Q3570]
MKKKKLIKIIPVVLIMVAFFLISEKFQERERTAISVDDEKFRVTESKSDLRKQLRFEVDMPDYGFQQRVDEYSLDTEIDDVNVSIMEKRRDFRIHSVVNQHLGLLITYSFNLLPDDEEPNDIPYLLLDRLTYFTEDKKPLEIDVQYPTEQNAFNWPNDGIVYENRLYRRVFIEADFPTLENDWTAREGAIEKIHKVELKDVHFIKKDKPEDQPIYIEDITLKSNFIGENTILETKDLEETLQLNETVSIHFKRLETLLYSQRLYLDIGSEDEKTTLRTLIYERNGRPDRAIIEKDEDGNQFLTLPIFEENMTDRFEFKILAAEIPSEEELTFKVTKEELTAYRKRGVDSIHNINRTLGVVNGTEFTLHTIRPSGSGSDSATIGFELKKTNTENYRSSYITDYTSIEEEMESYPEEERDRLEGHPFIQMSDQDGEVIRVLDLYGHGVEDNVHIQYFGIEKEKFKQVEELNVRIWNISNHLNTDEKELNIKLNQGGNDEREK